MPTYGGLWDVDWLSANSQRRYPFHDEASLRDASDSVTLPNDFVVDLVWPVHYDVGLDPTLFHLLSISVFGTGVTVTLGYDGAAVGSVTIDFATFVRFGTYVVAGTGICFDTVGKITIGSIDNARLLAGTYSFSVANGRLVPAAVRPDIRGVSSIVLQNGEDLSDPLQGNVILRAGRNIELNMVPGAGPFDPSIIYISAISGAGLNVGCDCGEAADLPCIKTINGEGPDEYGNFDLLESECLKLTAIANGLQLTDDCSHPCCGCDELNVVLQAAETMKAQINSLEQLANRIEIAMGTLSFNLLASR